MPYSRRVSQQVNKLDMPQHMWDTAYKGSPKSAMYFDPMPTSNRLKDKLDKIPDFKVREPGGGRLIAEHQRQANVIARKDWYKTDETSPTLASHPDEGTRGPSLKADLGKGQRSNMGKRNGSSRYRSKRKGVISGTN